jgi:sulfonate transport system substrate-binding protein
MINKTKKLILLIIAIGIILVGCGKNDTNTKGTNAVDTKQSAAGTESSEKTKAVDEKTTKLKTLRFALAGEASDLVGGGILGLAESKKYIEEELAVVGYKYEVIGFAQAGPAVNEAFVSGDIDVASYGDLPAVILKSKGIDVSVIAIGDSQGNMSIVVPVDSDIKSIADVKGKKVLVSIGTVIEQYWKNIVQEYGLDPSKVEIINDPANALSTFISGNADVLVSTDIQVQKVNEQYPVKVIDSTRANHPDWPYQGVVVTRNEFSKEHPEVLTALLKAYIRAYNDAVASPEEFVQSFVKEGITIDVAKKVYGDRDITIFNGNIDEKNIDKLEKLNTFLIDNKLTDKSVDIKSYVDNSFFKAAKKALGE